MKRLIFFFLLVSSAAFSQTGIGTTTPDASAKLDISSTSKGFLVPRMSSTQKTSVTSPANGLLIYQTDAPTGFYVNTGTSSSAVWLRLNSDWTKSGNDISFSTGNVSLTGNLTGGNIVTSKLSGFVSNVSTETGGRIIATADNGMILRYTGTTAATFTLPSAGTLPEGFNCMVLQASTGQITFGGTFNNRNSFTKTAGQYAISTVMYVGGVYIVSGEMSN